MNRRVIGRIISISHNNVVAELYNNLGNYVTLYDGIRFVGEIETANSGMGSKR